MCELLTAKVNVDRLLGVAPEQKEKQNGLRKKGLPR